MNNTAIQTIGDQLSTLSTADRNLLASLPYRAGLYVSFSDISGGWEAQEAEMQSLTNILREYSEDYCHSELAQEILMETLRERSQWPGWSQKIESVPKEAQEVIRLLKTIFPEKQINGFKEVLVDIALSVAMAFREDQNDKAPAPSSGLRDLLMRLIGSGPKTNSLTHTNISPNERNALMRLCRGLGYNYLQKT